MYFRKLKEIFELVIYGGDIVIQNYLKKVISSTVVITSIIAFNSMGASAEWKYDNNGYWYAEGNSYATGWRLIDSYWYYFNSNGYEAKGWQKLNGKWYYFGEYGGHMHSNSIDNGYYLDSNGVLSNAPKEAIEYSKKINNKAFMEENLVADIDNDGVMEAVELSGECEMDKYLTVFDYYDNSVHTVGSIYSPHGFIKGYNTAKQEFAVGKSGGISEPGVVYGTIYSIKDDRCEKVGTWYSDRYNNTYKIDGNVVLKEKFDQFMSDFKH